MTEKNPGWLQAESRTKRGNSRVIVNLMTRCEREMQTENSAERWAKGERVGRKQRKKDSRDREKTEEDKVRKMCTNKVETSEWVSMLGGERERERDEEGKFLLFFSLKSCQVRGSWGSWQTYHYCTVRTTACVCTHTHTRTHIGNIALILHSACWNTSSNSGAFVCHITILKYCLDPKENPDNIYWQISVFYINIYFI